MDKLCKVCGEEMGSKKTAYCSKECAAEGNRMNSRRYTSLKQKQYETRVCKMCGKKFQANKGQTTNCCSKQCLAEQVSITSKGRIKYERDYEPYIMRESHIDEINAEALNKGLSYGQLQAQKYIEKNRIKL
jgi:hypothetical protein